MDTKEFVEGQWAFGCHYFTQKRNPYPINSNAWKDWESGWHSMYETQAYKEGYDAFPSGNPWDNPYEKDSLDYKAWEVGYSIGHAHGGP